VDFLGHRVTAAGISPLQSRVEVVQKFPRPVNAKQLMSFLGLINFYRHFLPHAAHVLKPLTDSLAGSQPSTLAWSDEMLSAFDSAKKNFVFVFCKNLFPLFVKKLYENI
jgi:hypothetical protein